MNDESRRAHTSAVMLGWLLEKGRELSENTLSELTKLRDASPSWTQEMDKNADKVMGEVSGGQVDFDTDPSALLDVPLSQIIQTAEDIPTYSEDYSIEFRPFDGLTQLFPDKALDALVLESEQETYPEMFWASLLREWPESASTDLTCRMSTELASLPSNIITSLRFDLFRWLKENATTLASANQQQPLDVLDAILNKLLTDDAYVTSSAILEQSADQDGQKPSRRTFGHAINGPIGNAAMFLVGILESHSPAPRSGIPAEIKSRLEFLTTVPGEGSDHAVCILTRCVCRLHELDPKWASDTIVPWFDPLHLNAEPAWNGFCFAKTLPEPDLFSLIKPHFLNVFEHAQDWKWGNGEFKILHQLLVVGYEQHEHDESYLSADETRTALRTTNHEGRSQCIHFLANRIEKDQDGWDRLGKIFLTEVWPKENHLQSEGTTVSLVVLASVAGNNFPDVVDVIEPRLTHLHKNSWLPTELLSRTRIPNLIKLFPSKSLLLINSTVPDNPRGTQFNLKSTLENIAKANPVLRQDPKWQRLRKISRNE